MHGTAIAERIVEAASARARQMGCSSVKAVRVRVAAWSHLHRGELQTAFKAAGRGKPTENAELHIEVFEPTAKCEDCGADYTSDSHTLRCPSCGSVRVVMDESREIELDAIELTADDA
jgi:hydrogenase nickel incorporation protein HypA/HybF